MPARRVYDDYRWRKLRQEMRRRGDRCACGCGRLARDLHHKKPLAQGGAPFDRDNTVGLWEKCHQATHHPVRPPVSKG